MLPKGADCMAISGLSFRNTLVGSWWATSLLLCKDEVKKKQSSRLARHPSLELGEATFPAWVSSFQPKAVTIASSLMGGCGLSHECVEDGCIGHLCDVWGKKTQQS